MRTPSLLALLLLFGLRAAAQPAAPAPATPPARLPYASFTAPDGVRLAYRVAGRGDGVPVVFLHGGPGYHSHSFAVQAGPALEPALRLVYLDQRGCGQSERPASGAYSLDLLLADVEALRRHLGVDRIVPMGHSFGGALALEYAARYPQHTAALVLVAPLSDTQGSMDAWRDALRRWHPGLAARVDSAGTPDALWAAIGAAGGQRFFDRMQFRDDRLRARQDSLDAASGLANTGELSGALWQQGLTTYRFAAFDRIVAPVLLVGGAHDFAIGTATMDALAARLPGVTHHRYDDSAHFPYLEEPARFGRDLTAFLASRR